MDRAGAEACRALAGRGLKGESGPTAFAPLPTLERTRSLLRSRRQILGAQGMETSNSDLARWSFSVEEMSPGCYRAVGLGPHRLTVEHSSADNEEALERAMEYAAEMSRRIEYGD